ncbi:hypothetical protein ABPG75_006756 [Micractinium tetrahymenae]
MAAASAAARPVAAAAAELRQAMEDVEAKRHKRNPWAAQFVSLATTPFSAEGAQEGDTARQHEGQGQQAQEAAAGRGAVEAAATHVHIRTELIRSMKNALVKQTAEAVKRAAPAPAVRPRLGGKARQAAAAAAAAARAGQADPEEDSPTVALFVEADERLHQQLQDLLRGSLALNLGDAVQGLLQWQGDATRLAEADLTIDPASEAAPPPFDDFLRGLEAEDGQQGEGLHQPAQLSASEAAGLSAAVGALRQHAAQLEQQGLLQVAADAEGGRWLAQEGSIADERGQEQAGETGHGFLGASSRSAQLLPAYLRGQQNLGAAMQPHSSLQQWPPAWQGQPGPVDCDAIQEPDDGIDGWAALEGDASTREQQYQQQPLRLSAEQQPAPRSLVLQRQALGGAAIAVTFDDEQQGQQQHAQWQPQAGGSRQGTLSEMWDGGGSMAGAGDDPWDAFDEAIMPPAPHQQWQQPQQQQPARRVPTFAARRQPLSFSQPDRQRGFGGAADSVEDEEEEWDEDMLQQVAALEQQALEGQRQPQQQQQPLRAPVFRNRAFTQQQPVPGGAWPAGAAAAGSACADGIEESDSEPEVAAGPASRPAPHTAASQAGGPRAVPQLGKRACALQLSLAGPSAAAEEAPAGTSMAATSAGGRPPTLAARQQAAAAAADIPLLQIDFATVDLESLRPSVLLGRLTGGKQRWKPAYDPESLLLPPLRAALPTPQQLQQAAAARQHLLQQQQRAAAAAAELAGLSAADLAGWDDWGQEEEEDGPDDWGGEGAAVAGQWGDGQLHQQYRQQQGPHEEVVLEWDEPAPAPATAAAPAATAQQQRWQQAGAAALQVQVPPGWPPADSAAGAAAGEASAVDVCFDDEEEEEEPLTDSGACYAAEEEPQGSWWGSGGPASQLFSQFGAPLASQPAGAGVGAASAATASPEEEQHLSQQQAEQAVAWPAWGQQEAEAEPAAGWGLLPESAAAPGSPMAAAAAESSQDVWAAFDAAPDDGERSGQQETQEEAIAVEFWEPEDEQQPAAAGHSRGPAAAQAGAREADPWAALGQEVDAQTFSAAEGRLLDEDGSDASRHGSGCSAAAAAVSVAEEEPPAAGFGGLWGCDIQWEDEGPAEDAAEQAQQAAHFCSKAAAASQRSPSAAEGQEDAGFDHDQPLTLEWQYFDEAELEVGFAGTAGTAGHAAGAAARLAAALSIPPAVAAGQANAASSKRRHEEIGAAIIRALLEERLRERVDLQPLLSQVCRRLAAVLAPGGGAAVVALSALRQQCLAEVDASPQRYLMALLTAVHQHNYGAAARAQQRQEGGAGGGSSCTGAVAAAVALLAEALGERQLRLSCCSGAGDVLIAAGP